MPDIQTIIDKYGPTLWAAAQRQVQIDITVNYLWAGFFGVLMLAAIIALIKIWTHVSRGGSFHTWDTEDKALASIAPVVVFLFAFIFGATCFNAAIQAQLNPVFAAYQHLLPPTPD